MDVRFVDEIDQIDFAKATAMLAESYWVPGISEDEVVFSAKNSALVVGAYSGDEMVGYMRVISDKARFAYILDVIVDARYRKQGIGQSMVRYAMSHESMKLVYQWELRTRTAHGVYAKVGFKAVENPENWMTIQKGRPKERIMPK